STSPRSGYSLSCRSSWLDSERAPPPDRPGDLPSSADEPLHDTRQAMDAMRESGRPGAADWQAFHAALRSLTPRTYVTRSLLLCNLAVFVAMVLSGVSPLHPASRSLFLRDAGTRPHSPVCSIATWPGCRTPPDS